MSRPKAPIRSGSIRILRLLMTAAFLVILARVLHLQFVVGPVTRARQQTLRVRIRSIPAPRGTVVFADGTRAAYTQSRTVIAVHYRALERPLRESWIRSLAKRVDPDAPIDESTARFRRELEQLLPRLARLSGQPLRQLEARAAAIRQRITRMRAVVLARRARAASPSAALPPQRPSSWLVRLERFLADASPRRPRDVAVVLREETWFHPIVTLRSVPRVDQIAEALGSLPVVRLEVRTERLYPRGPLAAHVVGYALRRGDRRLGEWQGQSGVEASYDAVLRGHPGRLREVARGEAPFQPVGGRPPASGQSIELTIDPRLQRLAERLLASACGDAQQNRARSGCLVLMHAATGRLVVAASWPPFDPNRAAQSPGYWQRLRTRPDAPLLARFHQVALPPGSAFKPIVALAALDAGRVDVSETITCRGHYGRDPKRFRCWIAGEQGGRHGPLRLDEALAQSCNVYFFELGERLGPGPLLRIARRFGLGRPTGVDLPYERPGQLPVLGTADRDPPVELLNLAIGQGRLLVTPLQAACWTAALVNGGYLVRPSVVKERPPLRVALGLQPEHLEAVRRGMVQAVADPRGTAHRALNGLRIGVGAKTGTAQAGRGRLPHAWCTAFFPVARPQWVVVACLEHGGKGGEAAASIVRPLIQATLTRMAAVPP